MRAWRKLYSKMLESPAVAKLSDPAALLLTFLIAAQDDSGYYPWDEVKVRRVTLTRMSWSHDVTTTYAQELVDVGVATWESGGILLANGAKLNGRPRKDVETELYSRQRHVDATSTPRQHDVLTEQSRVEQSRVERAEGASLRKVKTPQKKVVLEIDQDFRERMRAKYRGVLGDGLVDEQIDLALSHKAAKGYSRVDLYVDNWLRREAERRAGGKEIAKPRDDLEKYRRAAAELEERKRRSPARHILLPEVQEDIGEPSSGAALP